VINAELVRLRIETAVISEGNLTASIARDVAFHMTDWIDDMTKYLKFCHDPESHTDEQVNATLLAFLLHAPNHLAAAAKLYADFPVRDIFEVGSVEV
jgi:hypothetical protein